ncbi:hypothetical protein FEL34_20960 [Escherichia coli]|nr:hypothetical protein [Escherichia coli]
MLIGAFHRYQMKCKSVSKKSPRYNRLDFTNFYEDLMNNQKIPDSGVLTQKVKEQIADQLKQAGQ